MLKRSCVLAACAAAALAGTARAQSVVYRLDTGSFYEFGCHGACACPVIFHQPLTGTFLLTPTAPDPLYEHYAISDVHWESAGHVMTGSGTYQVGGEVALLQQMALDLDIDGAAKHVESGNVQVQAVWPRIEISVDNSGASPLCYDTVIHIEASPLPSHCTADFDNDGNVGTDADIEAFFECVAGNCCAACASADFNGDGDIGTDADIESFFRVLGGGSC